MVSGLELIGLALSNDPVYVGRIQTGCAFLDEEFDDGLARQVTLRVAGEITCDGFGVVCTSGVTDKALLKALGAVVGKEGEAEGLIAALPEPSSPVGRPPLGVGSDDEAVARAALQEQVGTLVEENRVLAARVAAFEGNEVLAVSLLTGADCEEAVEGGVLASVKRGV